MTNQENQSNSTVCSDVAMLDVFDIQDIHDGIQMKAMYNREIFLGKAFSVVNNKIQV